MHEQTLTFAFSPAEIKRMRKLCYPQLTSLRFCFVAAGLQAIRVPILILDHRHSFWTIVEFGFIAIMTGFFIFAGVRENRRADRIPSQGSLTLSDSGFVGVIDGKNTP